MNITINGQTIKVNGGNISVVNGAIYSNGVAIKDGLAGIVKIQWEGPLASLTADCSVECGNVEGDVHGGNSVRCGDVKGNVKAGNSVVCGDVGGNCKAGNSITRR